MEHCIFHVDVNSAFLSWSALKQLHEDPQSVDLRTIPAAVGGDVKKRRGVITAKSIPAAKRGVQTGEPVVKALQKCPELVLVPSDFDTYRRYSRAFIAILRSYSDAVEQLSIDEAYLDVSGEVLFAGQSIPESRKKAHQLAERLRDEIYEQLGFTVNVGISENKLLAKMASDFSKPAKIHTLYPDEIAKKLWPLPVRTLYGCGAATARKLENMGLHTIGEVAHADTRILCSVLGKKGSLYIHRSANGIGSKNVRRGTELAKGYSNETTTPEDINHDNYEALALPIIDRLAEHVAARLQRDDVRAYTIGVIVKTDQFQRRSHQTTLFSSTNDVQIIKEMVRSLADALLRKDGGIFSKGYAIRLIGVSCSNLDRASFEQLSLNFRQ